MNAADFIALHTDGGGIVEPADGWRNRGLCMTADPDLFFPAKGEPSTPAKTICQACPVINECGAHGLLHESVGIWGGMCGKELKATRAQLGIRLTTRGGQFDRADVHQEQVHALLAAGADVPTIAAEVGISTRQVHRIRSEAA